MEKITEIKRDRDIAAAAMQEACKKVALCGPQTIQDVPVFPAGTHPIYAYRTGENKMAEHIFEQIDALRPDLAEARQVREDAERYLHCESYGWPQRNQTPFDEYHTWIAFGKGTFYGRTPTEAIDQARKERQE